MKTQEVKFTGKLLNGIAALLLVFAILAASVYGCVKAIIAYENGWSPTLSTILIIATILIFIITLICFSGFMMIEPNEARVMVFFGKYEGTVKENGFFWVNPFFEKKKLTLRARNLDAEPIKVNDKNGNPIMIGQVLVWKVKDTYKASFNVDNNSKTNPQHGVAANVNDKMNAYEYFVKVQSDAALRNVAGLFAYDSMDNNNDGITLRSDGDEINGILLKQLNDRLELAGIEIVEARLNYLAYAPEIAAVMLRRQQADAIISAREKIVDGAVSMVKMALDKLSEEEIIELDDDKKAAMVTNLLVILCSDEPAHPVVNSGTLYN